MVNGHLQKSKFTEEFHSCLSTQALCPHIGHLLRGVCPTMCLGHLSKAKKTEKTQCINFYFSRLSQDLPSCTNCSLLRSPSAATTGPRRMRQRLKWQCCTVASSPGLLLEYNTAEQLEAEQWHKDLHCCATYLS